MFILTVSNSVMSLRRHIQLPWSSRETLAIERLQFQSSRFHLLWVWKESDRNMLDLIGTRYSSIGLVPLSTHLQEECEAEWRVLSPPSPQTEVTCDLEIIPLWILVCCQAFDDMWQAGERVWEVPVLVDEDGDSPGLVICILLPILFASHKRRTPQEEKCQAFMLRCYNAALPLHEFYFLK